MGLGIYVPFHRQAPLSGFLMKVEKRWRDTETYLKAFTISREPKQM